MFFMPVDIQFPISLLVALHLVELDNQMPILTFMRLEDPVFALCKVFWLEGINAFVDSDHAFMRDV